MAHKTLVAVILSHDNRIFVGKHADGPFKGKWGVPSIDSSVDRRPSRVAVRLAESCCLGMLGTRNTLTATKRQPSALGLQLYEVHVELADLPIVLERACAFIQSCFPAGTDVPTGLVPWSGCKWISSSDEASLDPISLDALAAWKSQVGAH
jgi:hypothetical protein